MIAQSNPEQTVRRQLTAWSRKASLEGQLGGGYRNRVWAVRIGARRYIARLSARAVAALDWEIELLQFLRAAEMAVPEVLPARDGRLRHEGLILFGWLDGRPPSSGNDWRRVAEELRQLHALTRDWPQRPGFRSSRDLLREAIGGDVRLDMMPAEVVPLVREAWQALEGEPMSVVHGDPGAANIRLQVGKVGLIDWDEARVDVSLFDLAAVPLDFVSDVGPDRLARARRAAIAWEVANGWVVEPEYAGRRLAELEGM